MRVLHYALVIAVVLTIGTASAQEKDKPKAKPIPWWKLSDKAPAKQQPQTKDAPKESKAGKKAPSQSNLLDRLIFAPSQKKKPAPDAVPSTADRHPAELAVHKVSNPEHRERLVYRLANAPASDVAQVVNELLKSERTPLGPPMPNTVVLADVVSNSLIISGTSDSIHETVRLVEQLDKEPLMVHVEAVVGLIESPEELSLLKPNPDGPELSCSHAEACELIEKYSKSDAVKIIARPQLLTLDNQPAFLQIGDRVPRIKSTKDGHVTGTELENVGLIIGLTPRIANDRVVTMEIDLEKSQLGPEHQGVPVGVDDEGNVIRSPKIETMVVQTTVKIPSGQAVIIGGMALQEDNHRGELLLVVTPHVVAQKK